ncbi:hypothetical protein NB311A_13036 [Nitrobacter sp. Nb-311A]|jgi:hypothetical protein|uniref:hypothetical protein n=1 Tax=Nitrobacter vulgaris TaxID=29421 RepID=UPI00006849F9|nr:hypothetical protein [Nitrobacter vulgaris]EAQ35242.1 hypothetical protein NB311A_13036 [Nitrobacter sp. Nb-311A]MDR6306140.1 hypothetical protein [Nitrobacter vulgaris]
MAERRSSKQLTLQNRLKAWADKTREQADKLEPGPARDALLKKIEQAEKAARYDAWSRSPGLQPPVDPRGPSE